MWRGSRSALSRSTLRGSRRDGSNARGGEGRSAAARSRAARAENWKALRDQYNFDLEEKVKEERVKKIARESLKFDDKLLTKANDIIEQVTKYMALNEEALQENKKPFQPNQFLNLTNALLTAQKLGKIAMGEITESINVNTTIKEADAFRGIMELLDSAKEQRLKGDSDPLHWMAKDR